MALVKGCVRRPAPPSPPRPPAREQPSHQLSQDLLDVFATHLLLRLNVTNLGALSRSCT